MSEENVQLVRAIYEAMGQGRIPLELIDPEIELDLSERVFNPAVYHGLAGVEQFLREVDEIWETWVTEPQELIDAGDDVVAFVRSRGRGRGSGVEVEDDAANVWTVRAGRAVRYRLYRDRDEALRVSRDSG